MPTYKYPSLRTTLPIAGYCAAKDTGAAASDQFAPAQDGALQNGATRSNDAGLAYSFDGVNDQISFGVNAFGSGLNAATAISFAAWIKYASLVGAANRYGNVLFANRLSGDGAGLWINLRSDSGQAGRLLVGGRSRSADTFQEGSSSHVISAGTWTHIAGVLNFTAKTITTYVDGVATTTSSLSFGSNTYVNSTGTSVDVLASNSASTYYSGLIDDVLIYPIGLSAAQVGFLASQRGAIYQTVAAGGLINSQSLVGRGDLVSGRQLVGIAT